ncbi:MAG: phytanoyl-CoA dioxygenase family protein [Acidimicrobiia bacterium]|nr:phytanoyl-CoA dioxygenase family protein [Acidimicrobiia bacterium]
MNPAVNPGPNGPLDPGPNGPLDPGPNGPLGASQLDAFRSDGVVLVRGVLDDAWLALLADAIEADIAAPGPGYHGYDTAGGGRFHGNFDNWRSDPRLRRYCLESPLPAIAAQLLDSPVVQLFYDQLFVKEPATPSPTPWHNDQPYWPVAGRQLVSLWSTLDQVTGDSGALEFVRGSHLWDRWFQPRTFAAGGFQYESNPDYEPIPDFDAQRADLDLLSWDMEPGDVLAFHSLTVHGAGGNQRADRRRRGYTVRYAGADVRYDVRPGTTPRSREATTRPASRWTPTSTPSPTAEPAGDAAPCRQTWAGAASICSTNEAMVAAATTWPEGASTSNSRPSGAWVLNSIVSPSAPARSMCVSPSGTGPLNPAVRTFVTVSWSRRSCRCCSPSITRAKVAPRWRW